MENKEESEGLYVDFREFSTIYKPIAKDWRVQIIEIKNESEKSETEDEK